MKFSKKPKKKAVTIRLTQSQIEYLKAISRKYSRPGGYVSMNEIISKAIDEIISQEMRSN